MTRMPEPGQGHDTGERNRPMTDVPAQSTGDDTLYEPPGYPPADQAGPAAGDGDAWRRLYDRWNRLRDPLLAALFTPNPPIAATARLAVSAWSDGWTRVARFALLSVRRMGEEEFGSDAARRLLRSRLCAALPLESVWPSIDTFHAALAFSAASSWSTAGLASPRK